MGSRKAKQWVIAGVHVWLDPEDVGHCWWITSDGHAWHWYKGVLCEEGPRGPRFWEQFVGAPPMTLDAAVGFTVGYVHREKEMASVPEET